MENNIRKDLASPRPFRQEQRAEKQTDLSACPSARGANRPVICPSACTLQIPITSQAAKALGASREPVRSRSILCPAPVPGQGSSGGMGPTASGAGGRTGFHWEGLGWGLIYAGNPPLFTAAGFCPPPNCPGVAIPAPAPTRRHCLLCATNSPCDTQKRKTASSRDESWNNRPWVCSGESHAHPTECRGSGTSSSCRYGRTKHRS